MLFNSAQFLLFFPIVVILYFVLPQKIRIYWLLVASYYFYMCWNVKYVVLILISTIVTYLSGLLLQKAKDSGYSDKRKNLIVAGSFIINLGILGYFKYFNFFLESISDLFLAIGIRLNVPTLDILLPVGISFYTFQALSYTMDVYRDDIYAERNFFKYALFVSFFPQLVAGPIERSKYLLKQLDGSQTFEFERIRDGFILMLWGYFLKVVLADRIAIFVDGVYGNPIAFGGWYIVLATALFGVQIYCDFYGYSTIAMGAAKIIGINLMENFDAPYLAISVADFWRRWHISLTSWFKDYLYIPLGGSRKGTVRKYINKMIVFLVSGLWHGASLSFIVWGGINGIYQVIGEILMPLRDKMVDALKIDRKSIGHKVLHIVVTFSLVDFAWLFFRAGTMENALVLLKQMFSVHNPWILIDGSIYDCGLNTKNFWLMIICIFILLFADICKNAGIKIREVICAQNLWCRYLILIFAICAILTFGVWGSGYDAAGFIYFQF